MESKEYWNTRYKSGGNSGYGSYGKQLVRKLQWLDGLNISSISEIGCGDFNFGSHLMEHYPNATYNGYDISPFIIEKNKKEYPQYSFTDEPYVPNADLLLCIDVLFHILDDAEYKEMLSLLERSYTRYLAVTAYEYDEPYASTHVKIRKFDPSRFGIPLIRQVVEEDGELYFYLFKRQEIDIKNVSCCLITKESKYPGQILNSLPEFGEVLIGVNCPSPYSKYELFSRAKNEIIYYQDDDAICPIASLAAFSDPRVINVAMKQSHFDSYFNRRMTMGLGWGSFFPKSVLSNLKKYTDKYGEDELFRRDTEKILTELVPQNRFVLPIEDLPSAYDADRLWRQPEHWTNMELITKRCAGL